MAVDTRKNNYIRSRLDRTLPITLPISTEADTRLSRGVQACQCHACSCGLPSWVRGLTGPRPKPDPVMCLRRIVAEKVYRNLSTDPSGLLTGQFRTPEIVVRHLGLEPEPLGTHHPDPRSSGIQPPLASVAATG